MQDEFSEALRRIAIALERIADSLQSRSPQLPNNTSYTDDAADIAGVLGDLPDEAKSPVAESTDDEVQTYLASKGIQIKTLRSPTAADSTIDSLSLFLGERYTALRGVLAQIKRSMQAGKTFTESLAKLAQTDVSSVCQFCTRLHAIAFLEQYKYLRSPQYLIKAKATTLPAAQAFFGGQWLERFTLQKLTEAHAIAQAEFGDTISFSYLMNPQIILPNGDDFELDIIAVIGGCPIWIEAKSGDFQQHVQKYSRLSRLMGLEQDHAIMALTDVPVEQCDALSSLFRMTVVNLDTLFGHLQYVIRSDMGRIAEPSGER